MTGRVAASFAFLFALAQPAAAQYAIGVGADYLGYTFDDGLGADAAQLFMVPVAVRLPVADRLTFDVFGAWAEGRVEQDNSVLKLNGPVDASIKASYQATPWALVSVGVNLPTGNSEHDSEEALVASVLSADLLGFREATWGTGFAVTSSVATAVSAGGFGLGVAAAYAARSEFSPVAGDDLTYKPGNEARVRVGIDRNFGSSTLTVGGTFISYAQDQADSQNLFQAGNRIRLDAAFAFRAGSGVWTIYGANLMRQNGDLTVQILDSGGSVVDTGEIQTAKQNLFVGGLMGTVGLGGGFVFRPHVDVKLQAREEADGNEVGSGYLIAAGGDIPIRIAGAELFPKARVYFGSIKNVAQDDVSMLGVELKGTLRTSF